MRRIIALALVAGAAWYVLPGAAAQTPWALLAKRVLGKVEQLHKDQQGTQAGYDVASVLLDVPADAVFAKVVAMVRANHAVHIVAEDAATRRLELTEGNRSGSLTVASLGDNLSQILIAANVVPGQDNAASRMAQTVLRICHELHKQCSASG